MTRLIAKWVSPDNSWNVQITFDGREYKLYSKGGIIATYNMNIESDEQVIKAASKFVDMMKLNGCPLERVK